MNRYRLRPEDAEALGPLPPDALGSFATRVLGTVVLAESDCADVWGPAMVARQRPEHAMLLQHAERLTCEVRSLRATLLACAESLRWGPGSEPECGGCRFGAAHVGCAWEKLEEAAERVRAVATT